MGRSEQQDDDHGQISSSERASGGSHTTARRLRDTASLSNAVADIENDWNSHVKALPAGVHSVIDSAYLNNNSTALFRLTSLILQVGQKVLLPTPVGKAIAQSIFEILLNPWGEEFNIYFNFDALTPLGQKKLFEYFFDVEIANTSIEIKNVEQSNSELLDALSNTTSQLNESPGDYIPAVISNDELFQIVARLKMPKVHKEPEKDALTLIWKAYPALVFCRAVEILQNKQDEPLRYHARNFANLFDFGVVMRTACMIFLKVDPSIFNKEKLEGDTIRSQLAKFIPLVASLNAIKIHENNGIIPDEMTNKKTAVKKKEKAEHKADVADRDIVEKKSGNFAHFLNNYLHFAHPKIITFYSKSLNVETVKVIFDKQQSDRLREMFQSLGHRYHHQNDNSGHCCIYFLDTHDDDIELQYFMQTATVELQSKAAAQAVAALLPQSSSAASTADAVVFAPSPAVQSGPVLYKQNVGIAVRAMSTLSVMPAGASTASKPVDHQEEVSEEPTETLEV